MRHQLFATSFFIALALSGSSATPCHAQSAKNLILEQLWKATPANRMNMITKVVAKDDFMAADRGAVADVINERASLDAAKKTDIISRVQPAGPTKPGAIPISIIKWVVEDGTAVKKGEKLVELDASEHQKEVENLKVVVKLAEVKLQLADGLLQRLQKENAIEVKLAEIEVQLAELALKQYKGDDANQKQLLALQVDRARLLQMRAQLKAEAKEAEVAANRRLLKTELDRERMRLEEIEAVVANHVVRAPHDGMAVYYEPPQRRPGSQQALIAQGEPVRDGQKLMTICDLKQMEVVTRIPESLIFKVRVDQKANIQVDAYPNQTYRGKVTFVSAVADQAEFFNKDVKVYQVKLSVENGGKLRPGMSATAAITLAERRDCLRLPASAVLSRDKEKYCYVQVEKELQSRKLSIGLADGAFVEIIDGLRAGEMILRSPTSVVDRLEQLQNSKK